MIGEGKRLYRLGFAIHWLHTHSKKPIEHGWTKGDRKPWGELKRTYSYGLNMGVRLGRASRFEDGTYLAAIDCDVKSGEPRHLKEMEKKLAELIGVEAPQVFSGRGNGSRHIYVRTATPVQPFRFSQSSEKARVLMPSVKPSRSDYRSLKPHEIKEGYRFRPAWEISVMGDGQQTVLPPSTHPDTRKPYHWSTPIEAYTDLPLIDLGRPDDAQADVSDEPASPFQVTNVDLISSELPEQTVALILNGEGCTDRSAALFTAAIAMVKARFTDNDILTVLTDRETFLGEAAYEHANTGSRRRAAEWVRRYTLTKVKRELSAAKTFEEAVVVTSLDAVAAEQQAAEVLGHGATPGDVEGAWREKLERENGKPDAKPRSTLKNVVLILTMSEAPDVFKLNEFTHTTHYARQTAWGGLNGHEVRDIDLVKIKFWISTHFRFEPPTPLILEAIQKIGVSNAYHPIRDFLRPLEWDGVERLDNWLITYLGATGPRGYLRAVGRKTLTAMVARVMEPGCKFDQVLVIEGNQGSGKSTAVRILAEPWFSDAFIDVGDKDAILAMRLAWVVELGELATMRKSELEPLKQFVSQSTDRIRVPYGKLTENFPRQSIFIGTTNSKEYLKDTTGNRRFWPVWVNGVVNGRVDFTGLKRDREQLLAEAKFNYELGEPLYLDDPRDEAVAMREQGERVFVDEWVGKLKQFLRGKPEGFPAEAFSISDLFSDFGPLRDVKDTRSEQMRAAEALRVLGYSKRRMRRNGEVSMLWMKNDSVKK
jgi:predicted P-loop ATPase